jgi:hypothetical protein
MAKREFSAFFSNLNRGLYCDELADRVFDAIDVRQQQRIPRVICWMCHCAWPLMACCEDRWMWCVCYQCTGIGVALFI